MDEYRPFAAVGWILILLGVLFVALPYLARLVPSVERLPWYIVYVYRSDGFMFATSPLLILLSFFSLLWSYLRR
ncbi:MAG TPA: hypothetical protein VGB32_11635 [Candidatus Bathyarchaeia archaeon]